MKLKAADVQAFQREGYLKVPYQVIEEEYLQRLRRSYDTVFNDYEVGEGLRNLSKTESKTEEAAETNDGEMWQVMGMWKRNESEKNTINTIITSFNRNFAGRNDGSTKTHAFLMSPEMVIAKALSGKLNFDPQTDVIETPKNEKIILTPNRRQPIPKAGFVLNDSGYVKATAKKVDLKILPNYIKINKDKYKDWIDF